MPGAAVGPSAGRRLTEIEYINTVGDLLGVTLTTDDASSCRTINPRPAAGFATTPGPATVRGAHRRLRGPGARVSERTAWAGSLAPRPLHRRRPPACREGFIRPVGRVLYRRPLTDGEVHNLAPLSTWRRTMPPALKRALGWSYRRCCNRRIFSIDSNEPTTSTRVPERGARPLRARDAAVVPAGLSASTPELLDAAERGDLATDQSYASAVERVVAGAAARRGFQGYSEDWLQLYRLETRTPNVELGVSQALFTEMEEETMRFASRIALTEPRDLSNLFTDKRPSSDRPWRRSTG